MNVKTIHPVLFHSLFNDDALTEEDISEKEWEVINIRVNAEGEL